MIQAIFLNSGFWGSLVHKKTRAQAQRESERLKAENAALERDVVDLARLAGLEVYPETPKPLN